MLGNKAVLLGLGLAILLCGFLAFQESPEAPLLRYAVNRRESHLPRGEEAPTFTLASAAGDSLRLEDVKGKPSVLLFVTPVCPHCRKLKEELLARSLPDMQNQVVFISRSSGHRQELSEDIQALESRVVALYPVLYDSAGAVFDAYGVQGVPTGYLLDEEGKVLRSSSGEPKTAALVERVVHEFLKTTHRAGI